MKIYPGSMPAAMHLHSSPESHPKTLSGVLRLGGFPRAAVLAMVLLSWLTASGSSFANCCGGGGSGCVQPVPVSYSWWGGGYILWNPPAPIQPPPDPVKITWKVKWTSSGVAKEETDTIEIAKDSTYFISEGGDGVVYADPGTSVTVSVVINYLEQIEGGVDVDGGCFGYRSNGGPGGGSASLPIPGGKPGDRFGSCVLQQCSMDLTFGLGIKNASIWLHATGLQSTDLAPDKLIYSGPEGTSYSVNGVLTQVKTPEGLVVIDPNGTYGFIVTYYKSFTGTAFPYTPSGAVYKNFTISRPVGAPVGSHQAQVYENSAAGPKQLGVFIYDPIAKTWQMNQPGKPTENMSRVDGVNPGDYNLTINTTEIRNGVPVLVAERYEEYLNNRLTLQRVGPAVGGMVTTYQYDLTTGAPLGSEGPNGSWVMEFSLAHDNNVWDATLRPFGDQEKPETVPTDHPSMIPGRLSLKRSVGGNNISTTLNPNGIPEQTFTEEWLGGVQIGRRETSADVSGDFRTVVTKEWSGPNIPPLITPQERVTSVMSYMDSAPYPFSGRVVATTAADGTETTHTYAEGKLVNGVFVMDATQKDYLQETILESAANPVAHVSKKTVELFTRAGSHVRNQEYVCTVGGSSPTYSLLSDSQFTYDTDGNLTLETRDGRVVYSSVWTNGVKTSETDEAGTETQYSNHDAAGHPGTITYKGFAGGGGTAPAQPDVVTTVTYDGFGRELSRISTAGGQTLSQTITYDTAGRPVSESQNGVTNTLSYSISSSGGAVVTRTLHGGLTEVTESYRDGQTKSVTGSAVNPVYYSYGVHGGGNFAGMQWTRTNVGADPNTSQDPYHWTSSTTDWLNRKVAEETASPMGGSYLREWTYDISDRVLSEKLSGHTLRSFAYDQNGGNAFTETAYLNVAGSQSVVTTRTVTYEQLSGPTTPIWLQKTVTAVGGVTRSTDYEYAGGTADAGAGNYQTGYHKFVNEAGDANTMITYTNRSSKLVWTVTTRTGATIPIEARIRNGRQEFSANSSTGAGSVTSYDALGRVVSSTDSRTGYPMIFTYDGTYPDQVATQSLTVPAGSDPAAGQSISISQQYFGGAAKHAGKVSQRTENGNVSNYRYTDSGQVERVWGNTYPVRYEYDTAGRLNKLHTYKAEVDLSQGGYPTGDNVTQWAYYPSTNYLHTKAAEATTAGYQYDSYGYLWKHEDSGLDRTYTRDLQGRVTGISYENTELGISTPSVILSLPDAMGRYTQLVDQAGTHTFVFASDGRIASETISGGDLGTAKITRDKDPTTRAITLGLTVDGSPVTSSVYGFEATTGRFASVTRGNFNANYSYQTNADRVSTTTFKQGTTGVLTSTSTLDGLNRLHRIESVATSGGVTLHRTTYGYDARHRREVATEADNRKWVHGYNDRNEVTSGTKKLADNTPILGHSYSYAFDAIGNRTSTTVNGRHAAYSMGVENQLGSREVPAAVDVLGTSPASLVRVNEVAPARQGEEFYRAVPVDQSGVPPGRGQWVDIKAKAYLPGTGGQPDRMKSDDGKVYVPKSPQAFTYDSHGNLTGDGRWLYKWDAENRLVEAKDTSMSPSISYSYGYDAQSRRIWKKKTIDSDPVVVEEFRRFYYNGWNLMAETLVNLSGNTSAPVAQYTWGLDASGTMDKAGGIGGLLFAELKVGTETWHTVVPIYDGNGNVRGLADASTAVKKAEYSYGPFGEVVRANGILAPFNPIGWSTKYTDKETDLVYYGYRYYAAHIGRWLSRDPIEEDGGYNLYGMVENNCVSNFDYLGLELSEALKCCRIKRVIVHFTKTEPREEYEHTGYWNHPTGRVFVGTVTLVCKDGNVWKGNVQTGGMRTKDSTVNGPSEENPLGDDSAVPAGDFKIATSRGGKGFPINTAGTSRGSITMHYAGYKGSHGCPTLTSTAQFNELDQLMKLSNGTGIASVPIRIQYVGVTPKGNRGGGRNDPPLIPVGIPVGR